MLTAAPLKISHSLTTKLPRNTIARVVLGSTMKTDSEEHVPTWKFVLAEGVNVFLVLAIILFALGMFALLLLALSIVCFGTLFIFWISFTVPGAWWVAPFFLFFVFLGKTDFSKLPSKFRQVDVWIKKTREDYIRARRSTSDDTRNEKNE